MGGIQSQGAPKGGAIITRLHATRDAAERIVLPALRNDGSRHRQRTDDGGAAKADWRYLPL